MGYAPKFVSRLYDRTNGLPEPPCRPASYGTVYTSGGVCVEHASKMAVPGISLSASMQRKMRKSQRPQTRSGGRGVGWVLSASQALPSLPSEPSALKTANAMMSPSMPSLADLVKD